MAERVFPKETACPACEAPLILDENERISGEFTCPECGKDIQLNKNQDRGEISDDSATLSISAEGLSDEVLKGIHGAKSYVGTAFLTLLFYYIGFYLIGLICNLIFISQANNSRRISGSSPSGRGCLLLLIWIHLIIPMIVLIILVFTGALSAILSGF
jgi:predicted RNA-binding Zn-ribbon protein involved in translation (DUF1610 family)